MLSRCSICINRLRLWYSWFSWANLGRYSFFNALVSRQKLWSSQQETLPSPQQSSSLSIYLFQIASNFALYCCSSALYCSLFVLLKYSRSRWSFCCSSIVSDSIMPPSTWNGLKIGSPLTALACITAFIFIGSFFLFIASASFCMTVYLLMALLITSLNNFCSASTSAASTRSSCCRGSLYLNWLKYSGIFILGFTRWAMRVLSFRICFNPA